VEQRHATSEIRLDVRRARYREGHLSDAAQIARFGSGRGFSDCGRKTAPTMKEKRRERNILSCTSDFTANRKSLRRWKP
jgi:hypothetical protein